MTSSASRPKLPEMVLPDGFQPTSKALAECARAMRYLVEDVGWPPESQPELERLWWTVRDERGNVREK